MQQWQREYIEDVISILQMEDEMGDIDTQEAIDLLEEVLEFDEEEL